MRLWICLVFLMSALLSTGAQATPVLIFSPGGIRSFCLGREIFRSHSLESREENGYLVIEIRTNYPGPHSDVEYNIGDLRVDFHGNSLAVKLSGGNRGKILLNPRWETSQMFQSIGAPFGRYEDGKFIPVQATGGTVIGEAEVEWLEQGNGEYVIKIKISLDCLKNLPGKGKGGKVSVEWPTAFCANSLVRGECDILFPQTGWGGGGPGYIPPADHSVSVVPPYAGVCSSPGGFSGSGRGGGNFLPGYPFPYPPDNPPPFNPPPDNPPPIPLPGTVLLLASGLALLGIKRWRGKAN